MYAIRSYYGNSLRHRKGGGAKNQEDVEDVAADDVADSNLALALQAGDNGGRQFRQGGAYSDDGQPDDQLADAEAYGDFFGSVD